MRGKCWIGWPDLGVLPGMGIKGGFGPGVVIGETSDMYPVVKISELFAGNIPKRVY